MDKNSDLLKHEGARTRDFQPNPRLVERIEQLRALLEPLQARERQKFSVPRLPVLLIVGNPRSGSTVLTQVMAASGQFAYPSNFLARFSYAPQIGAMIEQMLFDPNLDYRSELADIQSSSRFTSALGKTSGALGINEFFHFWRRFFPNHDPGHLSERELAEVDIANLRRELAAIESVFSKPFMAKGKMIQYNLVEFAHRVPEFVFIHIKREHTYVMQSVLEARRKYYGTDAIWWGTKPRQYEWLSDMDPFHQIAGQVLFTEREISEQLKQVDPARQLVCQYESFCAHPDDFLSELRELLKLRGFLLDEFPALGNLSLSRSIRLPQEDLRKLETAYVELKRHG